MSTYPFIYRFFIAITICAPLYCALYLILDLVAAACLGRLPFTVSKQIMEKSSSSVGPTVSCQLLHHGVAATSSSKATICIPSSDEEAGSSEIVYASHSILNVAHRVEVQVNKKKEPTWTVYQTLRTNSHGSANANTTVSTYTAKRVISCVTRLRGSRTETTTIVCGFTDGTLSSWRRQKDNNWIETILVRADDEQHWDGRSVTDVAGIYENDQDDQYCIVTCSSGGAVQFRAGLTSSNEISGMERIHLLPTPASAVRFHTLGSQNNVTLLLVGTAAPRNNKIHVFVIGGYVAKSSVTHYCGALSGHEDWISCFDWRSVGSIDHLASGSHDARIRLWKFTTVAEPATVAVEYPETQDPNAFPEVGDNLLLDDDEEDMAEGESRLEVIVPHQSQTSVTLEALLIGHEEGVTSVSWHPNPKPIYGEDLILLSSSMDRSIFIWSEVSGIWAPISRVGSAGGILGGSIGSSLLGFLHVEIDPLDGMWMMAHAYGGSLHFFSCEKNEDHSDNMSVEERAALSPWKAQPCITGHFDAVTDLCWESSSGDYLLTVGNDQTCRAWAPLAVWNGLGELKDEEVWVEIARPQVHGYDLSAITSLSTRDRRHLIVTGADEKELRVFDATKAFTGLLRQVCSIEDEERSHRVDLAYIPSLGLSNKASAAEGAEQDSNGVSESSTQLPLERDLGAMSLWPETLKLYGHNTELVRLTSTTESTPGLTNGLTQKDTIVASSARARDAEAACIRLWNVGDNRCLQVLSGGHRSTVTAMSFSPDSKCLVTSGKDRRLCVWTKIKDEFTLARAVDAAHKRIVWGAHFCPFDSSVFATCSRDGSVKIWRTSGVEPGVVDLKEIARFAPRTVDGNAKPESVSSVAFAPVPVTTETTALAILAVGLDNGMVELWHVPLEPIFGPPAVACVLPPNQCHSGTVTKLAWRPQKESGVNLCQGLVLASASSDHGCRIWRVLHSK